MNIAIHGEKELLIRLREDLVKAGFEDDEFWNKNVVDPNEIKRMIIYNCNLITMFESEEYRGSSYHLTATNYTEILNKIIEKK